MASIPVVSVIVMLLVDEVSAGDQHEIVVSSSGRWTAWSPCSEPCGLGIKSRTRYWEQSEETLARPHTVSEVVRCYKGDCPALPHDFNLSSCTSKHFMCWSRQMCIKMDELCDNTVQCHDGSDEKQCYGVH